MQILEYKDEFRVQVAFNRLRKRNIAAIKKVPGARFDWNVKAWRIPLSQRKVMVSLQRYTNAKYFNLKDEREEIIGDIKELPELDIEVPLKHPEGYGFRPYQTKGVARGLQLKRFINGDEQGLGKAQPYYSLVSTQNGWKCISDLETGDKIFGLDGFLQEVTGVFPQGICDTYRVYFNDGSFADCNLEHIWTVRDQNRRRRNKGWTTKTLNELFESGLEYKSNEKRRAYGAKPILKWEIPTCSPIQFNERDFVIPPYIMGALLGDGCLTGVMVNISISDHQPEIRKIFEKRLPEGLKMRVNRHPDCPQYYITQTGTTKKNPFKQAILDFGLNVRSTDKFIPIEYLTGSVSQRRELLRGLMDTDGSAKQNRITFHTMSLELAKGITELVQSLGGIAKIREYDRVDKGLEYQVNIKVDFVPFYVNSKIQQCWKRKRPLTSRYIKSIKKIGSDHHYCISVSNKDCTYLTDQYIPTHNTLQSIGTLQAAAMKGEGVFPCLIICPASLKINWKREVEMWTTRKAAVLDSKIADAWHRLYDIGMADVFITNYESLKKYFVKEMPPRGKLRRSDQIVMDKRIELFKSVIVDESHRCKNPSTQQAKLTLNLTRGKEWVILLTGTPVVNKPIDLFPQLAIMGRLKDFGNKRGFLERYCEGGRGAANLKELNYFLNKYCFFRREKSQVAKDLPEKQRQTILCDITTRKDYNRARDEFERYLRENGADDVDIARKLRGAIIVKMTELKRISALGKLAEVKEFVRGVMDAGEKLILFCNLHAIVDDLKGEFPDAVMVTGRENTQQKQESMDAFQDDPNVQLIICNIKAAGTGITLTASSRVAFVEYPWTYADCVQCEDRAHRIGQVNNVMCTYFLGQDTIDERMYELIQRKRHVANTITGATDNIEMDMVKDILELFHA